MELVIHVRRQWYSDKSTVGLLTCDDFSCFTLEDTVRRNGIKIFGKTAIPSGKYEVIVNYSNHFEKLLPLLLKVPNYGGVRIHSGNRPKDTEGCILVGKNYKEDTPNIITESRLAFNELFDRIKDASLGGKIYFSIVYFDIHPIVF